MIKKVIREYKKHGFTGLITTFYNSIFPQRAHSLALINRLVGSGRGLEIGGPSPVFRKRGSVPIYSGIASLDNCNFSSETTWEGAIKGGETFKYHQSKKAGIQYICEASNLSTIDSSCYDFLLSSHVIEHLANPIRGLYEWKRVLKESGHLILLIPDYRETFDHKRPVTNLDHLISDFDDNIEENDLTHLQEILELHDLNMDPGAGSFEEFKERSMNNVENRCLHQHVFDQSLAIQLMTYMKFQVLALEKMKPHHIMVVAKKSAAGEGADNSNFIY